MATNRNFIVKNGLEVDGDTLFVDPTNNRVGIKDSTPSYDLDVAGTGRFTGDVNLDNQLIIDNTNSNGLTVTGGVGDTYPHITLGGGGPQTIKFLDAADAQGLELVYRTSPDELKIEKGSSYTLFSADRDDGSIKLYYGNSLKWETTNTGVKATGNITLTGNQYFGDNQTANFGDSNDLQIYHDGSNSYINDDGDGALRLVGNQVAVRFNAENMAVFNANADVQLYYDNVQKFNTTTLGTSTTGLSNADVFQSDGGTYAAASETVTNAALVIPESSTIYTDDGGYLRALIGKNGDDITIGQHNTALITDIELKPGNNGGAVKLHHAGASDNIKLQTTGSGVSVTGTASATTLSTGASGTGINISSNTISGPSTLTIDPAGVGNNTGTLVIAGDLQVDGTTTTINSTTVNVDDLNLTLASGAANAAAANGAGITIDGASATLTYVSAGDNWKFNKDLVIGNDDNGGHATYDSTAALRVDGDAGVGLFVTNNAQNSDPVAVFYKNDEANNVPAVIISSDADNGSESIFDVRGRASQSTADLSATSDSADTILDVRGDTNVYVTGDLYTGGRYSSSTKYRVLNTNDESSLNVDQVDGLHASSFLRSDANDTATGAITFSNQVNMTRYGGTHFHYSTNYDTYITYGAAAGGVFFRTYNGSGYSTKVTLNKDGNFGIGVTPTYKLHVSGEAFVTGNINNGGFDFKLGASNQTSRGNSGNSRALVKQSGDPPAQGEDPIGPKLVVNYANDFGGGTEVQSNLTVTGSGGIKTTNGRIRIENGTNGWVEIGPTNTSYSHFTTDRPRYYFNKKIVVDEGIVSSYNEDLLLYANNSSTLGVRVTNSAATTLYYNSNAKLATTNTGVDITGNSVVTGAVYCDEINDRTGTQLVLNAGEAQGKFSGQTGELIYLNAEGGVLVSTPDSGHSNFEAGYTQDSTRITGTYITIDGNTVFHGGNDGTGSGLDADLLDGQQGSAYLRSNADNNSATGNIRTSNQIEAGRGSGSIALTPNDGYGNANLAFNHRGGVPDVNGSSGRIECSVDSTTANMYFELGNSSTANTARSLTTVMDMTTGAINLRQATTAHSNLTVTGTTTFNGAQTWNGNITWNTGKNIYIDGESSFDVRSGGTWAVYNASNSNVWMTATYGQPLYMNNNSMNVIVNTSSSSDYFQIRHDTDTDITMSFYCESQTSKVADTFSDNSTDKKYISFSNPNGSNDPGFIMHETSNSTSPDERNEGVLHLVPSDDNGYGDYVSIHGTNDPDCLKLHTDGRIETAGTYNLSLQSGGGVITMEDRFVVNAGAEACVINSTSNQLLLYNDADETVIHRNDGSNYYILLSATGATASNTWNSLRPFFINTGSGLLQSNNGQTFAGGLSTSGTITLTGSAIFNHHATSSVDKIRVWNSSSYSIGMVSGRTHGRLNDYAMTFTMNNESDRGFLWRDTSHGASGGAMSLSTDGGLAVSRGINTGCGETDTGYHDHPLHVDNNWQTGQNSNYTTVYVDADYSGTAAYTANRTQTGLRVDMDSSRSNTTSVNGNRHYLYGLYSTVDSSQYTHDSRGLYSFAKVTANGSGIGTQSVFGAYTYAQAYAAGGAVNAYGIHSIAYRGGSTSGGTLYAVYGRAQNTTNGSGKSGNAVGGFFEVECDEDTIGDAKAVFAHIDRDGGTITTGYLYYGSYAGTVGTKRGIWLAGCTDSEIAGNLTCTGNITAYSDIKLKENIEDLENSLDKVCKLRGVSFNRKDLEGKPKQIGVIAQEIEQVIPEVVSESPVLDEKGKETGEYTKTVAYGNMVGLLIEAIKDQQKQIDELKAKLENN